jgi:prophage regulatory protein
MSITIIRLPRVMDRTGRRRSAVYDDIARGVITRPVACGRRAVGWPSDEIDIIVGARIAGRTEDEIRAIVDRLHAARQVGIDAAVSR